MTRDEVLAVLDKAAGGLFPYSQPLSAQVLEARAAVEAVYAQVDADLAALRARIDEPTKQYVICRNDFPHAVLKAGTTEEQARALSVKLFTETEARRQCGDTVQYFPFYEVQVL